jgi:PPOX class probable F420-dependent enzyme
MRIPESAIEHLLTNWPVARLATTNADGSPHQVPIVFSWHGGCFWSAIDGKPKQQAEPTRVANAIANPKGSMLIDRYDDDWAQLWWIRADIEITVLLLDKAEPGTSDLAREAIGKLEEKYTQYDSIPILRTPSTILALRPITITTWCMNDSIFRDSGN